MNRYGTNAARPCRAGRLASVVGASSIAITLLAACGTKQKEKSNALAAIASGSLAVRSAAPPAAPSAPEKPIIRRPKDAADVLVTDDRRARVESFAPQAKGFLTSADLEEKLYALNLKRGKDSDAIRELDRLAAGKWVLFTGNIGSPAPGSLELPIRYTPRDPNDPMGLTSVWLAVKLTNIQGYSDKEYRPGELGVVLARYDGQKKASEGYDLVLLQKWFE